MQTHDFSQRVNYKTRIADSKECTYFKCFLYIFEGYSEIYHIKFLPALDESAPLYQCLDMSYIICRFIVVLGATCSSGLFVAVVMFLRLFGYQWAKDELEKKSNGHLVLTPLNYIFKYLFYFPLGCLPISIRKNSLNI